uniref:Uncharacterized protein n=1 Tax=Spongospora subterranea TaxID=70186 RepID=A0A0H5QTU6_9EUKA|eukprot:CRZ05428.1 hypothetical protein [Spongospora subterranea]
MNYVLDDHDNELQVQHDVLKLLIFLLPFLRCWLLVYDNLAQDGTIHQYTDHRSQGNTHGSFFLEAGKDSNHGTGEVHKEGQKAQFTSTFALKVLPYLRNPCTKKDCMLGSI